MDIFSLIGLLLALVALVSLPLIGVIMGIIGPKSQKAFQTQWKKVGRLNSRVEESFSGHALVKVFGREKSVAAAFQEENDELYEASFKAQFLSGVMMPSMQFVGYLTYAGIAVLGGIMVASGQIRIGDVQAFVHGEAGWVRQLRSHLRFERAIPRERLSISGYWRRGATDEQWRAGKRAWIEDVEAEEQRRSA